MITDAQYAAWLASSDAIRTTLAEATCYSSGVAVTRYLSSKGYTTGAADTPANTAYLPIMLPGFQTTESISLVSEGSFNAGELAMSNGDGALDSWLNDIWINCPVKVWVGDIRWARSDFRMIFNGVTSNNIQVRDRSSLSLIIRDKLQMLNTPVTDLKLGGSTPNADSLIPVPLGECHNPTPLLSNPVSLEYTVASGPVEAIFEVRDNGKPVTATVDNSSGKFNLTASPAGAITCSLQGVKVGDTYLNTIASLIKALVTSYGKTTGIYASAPPFTVADIDVANFAAFDAQFPQPVGLWLDSRTTLLDACAQLASSVGAQMVPSRGGLLRLIQFAFPTTATTDILVSDQADHTLTPVDRTDPVASVKVAYCRNYTVQSGLLTSIPAQHKDLFAKDWLSRSASDPAVQAAYKLNVDAIQQETCLLVGSDATVEAGRRLLRDKVVRTTYRFEGTPTQVLLVLGQPVKLYSSRFGLSAGKVGILSSLTINWANLHVTVEVTI